MIAEEFSFPVITTNNVSHLPPLWRISSISREPENDRKIRKIFTSFSGDILKIDASGNDEMAAQEKMDVLWEDFNETLDDSSADSDITTTNYNSFREEFETLEVKLVPAKGRRKMELVVKKMMKKLLLLHNTPKRGPNSSS